MTTYTDAVYSALLTADEPMSSRALYEAHDTFESAEQTNKAVAYLVKTGRAEMVGTTKPSKGKTVRLYRALTPDEQAERAPSALDQQLAEAIRERDSDMAEAVIEQAQVGSEIDPAKALSDCMSVDDLEASGFHQLANAIRQRDSALAEAVIEPLSAAEPMIGEWPDALEERPERPRECFDDPMPKAPRYELKRVDRPTMEDPIISAIWRLPVGCMKLQGLDHDIRRVRSLADTIGDASPDVSGWLNELANKLESAA